MSDPPYSGRFTHLLLEGLAHYRRGEMADAMRAWEAAYHTDNGNVQAREFLRTALQRLRSQQQDALASHPWLDAVADTGAPPPGERALQTPVAVPRAPTPAQGTPRATPLRVPHLEVRSLGRSAVPGVDAPPPPRPSDAAPAPPLRFNPPLDPTPAPDTPVRPLAPTVADLLAPQPAVLQAQREVAALEAQRASISPALLLREARDRLARRDYAGAMELTAQILASDPSHAEAHYIDAECETRLTELYEAALGDHLAQPQLLLPRERVLGLNLDAAAGYLLAQIDGQISYEELFAVSCLSRLETARILARLVREGVIGA